MVNAALKYEPEEIKVTKNPIFLPTPITYGSVGIAQMISNNHRFDASAYNIEAMNALHRVYKNKFGWVYLLGRNGLIADAFAGARFKRIYTDNSRDISFYLPSDIENIYPKAGKYISTKTNTDIDSLRVRQNMLLVSVSGTIGKTCIVRRRLDGSVFSHDLLRVVFRNEFDLGFVYAFLNTDIGRTILQSNNYGAVIDHIEPEHLSRVPIPNAPDNIKQEIHNLIIDSFDLRDQSNDLIDKAQKLLYQELQLPDINEIRPDYYLQNAGFRNFIIKTQNLNGRLDASYHIPEIHNILKLISRYASEMITLGDYRISKDIVLPSRFKRVYVENSSNGVPFIGGRQLFHLNPSAIKYLSNTILSNRLKREMKISCCDILLPSRGSIGRCQLVGKHMQDWFISDNIIKIIHANKDIIGYVFCFLQSDYGRKLITKEVSGSVVDVIEPANIKNTPIPLLKNKIAQKTINDCILRANEMRYQAYLKEQEAINKMNEILNEQ